MFVSNVSYSTNMYLHGTKDEKTKSIQVILLH